MLLANAFFTLQILENTCTESTIKPQFLPGVQGDIQVEWHTLTADLEVYVRAPYDVECGFVIMKRDHLVRKIIWKKGFWATS